MTRAAIRTIGAICLWTSGCPPQLHNSPKPICLEQLAAQVGHKLDLAVSTPGRWVAASRATHDGDDKPMGDEIGHALTS